jgi:hypothetical protein
MVVYPFALRAWARLRFAISIQAIAAGDLLFSRMLPMNGVPIGIADWITALKRSRQVLIVAFCCAFTLFEAST